MPNRFSQQFSLLFLLLAFAIFIDTAQAGPETTQAEDSLFLWVDTSQATYCDQPEARQFDFWLGEWELTWGEGETAGTGYNSVTAELRECMIEENFASNDPDPFVGRSISVFDKKSGNWKQTWTDNRGAYLDFVGGWEEDRMILSRSVITDSVQFTQRMVWHEITEQSFEWNWERSDDNGESWQVLWNIHYVRE